MQRKGGAKATKKPADMIQWIIDNSDAKNATNTKFVTKTQMLISVVAIHTTTMTASSAPSSFTPFPLLPCPLSTLSIVFPLPVIQVSELFSRWPKC